MSKTRDHAAPLHILFIEDVEDDVLLLTDHLQSAGLVFDWQRVDTENGMLAKLQESWDIIFSDFSMPHLCGTRALEIVRQHDPDIPFIFVSGTIGEDIAVEAMKCGAQDYVMKENLNRLLPAVERELREAQQRRERRGLAARTEDFWSDRPAGGAAGPRAGGGFQDQPALARRDRGGRSRLSAPDGAVRGGAGRHLPRTADRGCHRLDRWPEADAGSRKPRGSNPCRPPP